LIIVAAGRVAALALGSTGVSPALRRGPDKTPALRGKPTESWSPFACRPKSYPARLQIAITCIPSPSGRGPEGRY